MYMSKKDIKYVRKINDLQEQLDKINAAKKTSENGLLDKIMGVEEASKKWGISTRHVKNLCRDKEVESIKINGTWVMPKNEIYTRRRGKVVE